MRRPTRKSVWRAGAPVALMCAGLLFATSATNARGTDLRPSRNTTLAGLVEEQSRRSDALAKQAATLRREIDALQARQGGIDEQTTRRLAWLSKHVGTTAVTGPGMTVTLQDAPKKVLEENPDIDADWLVIHQQDIQAVVNALWAGGADAISIQGHRIISTTGIKCVGNSVVLHGVPYLPPYRISAIGDPVALQNALSASKYIDNLKDYVVRFQLGYEVRPQKTVTMPAYEGTLELEYAHLPGDTGPTTRTTSITSSPSR
ncbi:MAG TPA: DUF881 domain-containing protein [Kribbellaceae bacterium]